MNFNIAISRKWHWALITWKRFLTCVGSLMNFNISISQKWHWALITWKRFLTFIWLLKSLFCENDMTCPPQEKGKERNLRSAVEARRKGEGRLHLLIDTRPWRNIKFEASNCEASHFCEASHWYSHSHQHICKASPKIAPKLCSGKFDSHSTRHDKEHFAAVYSGWPPSMSMTSLGDPTQCPWPFWVTPLNVHGHFG